MPTYFNNPENALKRANEFYELGKTQDALECLYDALKNRKNRIMKQIHEIIVDKFLELCVELKKSQMAKDGLYSYRNLCQGINVKSFGDSVLKYLHLAENKVEEALEIFHSVILNVDDLDQDVTPEMLLKSVSSERAQERTERIVLLPWVKFLWECYRNCLDLLRTPQTDKLYHEVAHNAFKFCVKFSLRTELHKLCTILRMHSMHIQKSQADLKSNDVDALQLCLETGLVELECTFVMEIWQDAFKAIEDIHSLINVSKKFQHSRLLALYYDKISRIFWKSDEYLFHAAANLRHFLLVKDQKKNLTSEDLTRLACRVVASILAVPLPTVYPATNLLVETDVSVIDKKNRSLSSLLDLSKCPTRDSLIKEVVRLGITQYLPDELRILFNTLEIELETSQSFISLGANLIEKWVGSELEQYIQLMRKVIVAKLLSVLPNMYVNIKMSKLLLYTGFTRVEDMEIVLVDCARRYDLSLRIDHKNMCVHFPSEFKIFKNDTESATQNSSAHMGLKYLVHTHSRLKQVVEQIHPELKEENRLIAQKIARQYKAEEEEYRNKLLERKNIIETYKECIETQRLQKEEEERKRAAEKLLRNEAAERERLLKEAEERNMQSLKRAQEEIRRKVILEKMETFKKSALGSQILESLPLKNLDNLDPQIIFSKQIEQLNKERKELTIKLHRQERRLDHLERAKRTEEIPLFLEEYEKNKVADRKLWQEYQRKAIESACIKRAQDLIRKKRFLEIKGDMENFLEVLKKNRADLFREETVKFSKMLEEKKLESLQKRAEDRKQKRKEQWIEQQARTRKERESNAQDMDDGKYGSKHSSARGNTEDRKIQIIVSPYKTSSENIVDETIFTETVSKSETTDPASLRRRFCHSPNTYEEIRLPTDIYYTKKMFKTQTTNSSKRTDVYGQRTSFNLEVFSTSRTKSKHEKYGSDYKSSVNKKQRKNILECAEENTFSWRSPWSKSFSNLNQNKPKDDGFAGTGKITILRRERKLETLIADGEKLNEVQSQKLSKTEERKNDTQHSCTPWAKLKRQATEK